MTEIATIDCFGRWGTSVFSENTAIFETSFGLGETVETIGTETKTGLCTTKTL